MGLLLRLKEDQLNIRSLGDTAIAIASDHGRLSLTSL